MANRLRDLIRDMLKLRQPQLRAVVTSAPPEGDNAPGYVYARVEGSGSLERVLNPANTFMMPGDVIRVQQQGQAGTTSYVAVDVQAGMRPDSGLVRITEPTVIGDTPMKPGDMLWGNPNAGNVWLDCATGHIYLRNGAHVQGLIDAQSGVFIAGDPAQVHTVYDHASIDTYSGETLLASIDANSRTIYGYERLGRPHGPAIEWREIEDRDANGDLILNADGTPRQRYAFQVIGFSGVPVFSLMTGSQEDEAQVIIGANPAGIDLSGSLPAADWSPTPGQRVIVYANGKRSVLGSLLPRDARFDDFMLLGPSGGIYQGSGTPEAPDTGLKIWNDAGAGRIAGFKAGVEQVGFDTDGKFKWAAGNGYLDSHGMNVVCTGTAAWNKLASLNFMDAPQSANNPVASVIGVNDTTNRVHNLMLQTSDGGAPTGSIMLSALGSDGADGGQGYIKLVASGMTRLGSDGAQLQIGKWISGPGPSWFKGLQFRGNPGCVVDLTMAPIKKLGDATQATDALNRRTGDGRYVRAASATNITFPAREAGRGPNIISAFDNGPFNGHNDPTVFMGYNHTATAGPSQAGEPAALMGIEGYYDDGSGQVKMEMYWQWSRLPGQGGSTYRPFFSQANRTTGVYINQFCGDSTQFLNRDASANILDLQTGQMIGFEPLFLQGAQNEGLKVCDSVTSPTKQVFVTHDWGRTSQPAILTLTNSSLSIGCSGAEAINISTANAVKFVGQIGFYNTAPAARSTGWATNNVTAVKVLDADSTTKEELADVLCTLIEALKTYGLLGA